MIRKETGMKLLEMHNFDYRQVAVIALIIELSEGKEKVSELLEGIPTPQIRKNMEGYIDRLRDVLGMKEEVTGVPSAH